MSIIKKTGNESVEYLEKENLIRVTIPIKIIKRGGKSIIETPNRAINLEEMVSLQHALICGHRWMKMLERGKYTSCEALAKNEKTDKSRVAKCIRLTALAPDIQEAVLCNTGTWILTLKDCSKPFPMVWAEQRIYFSKIASVSPESSHSTL